MKRDARHDGAAALDILKRLREAGHTALFAGGCVRDRLLNRVPQDYDVATDAIPSRVKELFPRARQVGAKFGVMLIRRRGVEVEVATFRVEGAYSDGRHPDEVRFGSESEDAARRDFTINGLFFDPVAEKVIDHVAGQVDLAARVIRTIGDPHRRFGEDHLRMLRAVRFAARLGFTIEPPTMEAIVRLAKQLETISAERIWQELEQILISPTRAVGWALLAQTGLGDHLAQTWTRLPEEDEGILRRLRALASEPIDPSLALAVVLGDRTSPQAVKICRGLRLSNRMVKSVSWLLGSLPAVRQGDSLELADLKLLMANENWGCLLELLRVDPAGSGQSPAGYQRLAQRAATIASKDVAPPPYLDGDDLHALGVPPGPRYGEVLEAVYRAQLNEEITDRSQARAIARRLLDL